MGEAPGRDSRPETLRRAVPKKEGVNDDAPREHPETPSGKGGGALSRKKESMQRAGRALLVKLKRLVFKKACITI